MSRHVTGTHTFTMPYEVIPGRSAGDIECRCQYRVYLGRPANLNSWPGDPAEPEEVQAISHIQVETCHSEPHRWREEKIWLEPTGDLLARIEAYLDRTHDDIIYSAREQFDQYGADGPDADDLRDRLRDDRLTGDAA